LPLRYKARCAGMPCSVRSSWCSANRGSDGDHRALRSRVAAKGNYRPRSCGGYDCGSRIADWGAVSVEMPSVHLSEIDNSQSAIPSVAGSPLWQAAFVSFAVILILFEV